LLGKKEIYTIKILIRFKNFNGIYSKDFSDPKKLSFLIVILKNLVICNKRIT
jgi:hypothetical protein